MRMDFCLHPLFFYSDPPPQLPASIAQPSAPAPNPLSHKPSWLGSEDQNGRHPLRRGARRRPPVATSLESESGREPRLPSRFM